MSSMRTKTHVADIVGDNVFCEKIADKKSIYLVVYFAAYIVVYKENHFPLCGYLCGNDESWMWTNIST